MTQDQEVDNRQECYASARTSAVACEIAAACCLASSSKEKILAALAAAQEHLNDAIKHAGAVNDGDDD